MKLHTSLRNLLQRTFAAASLTLMAGSLYAADVVLDPTTWTPNGANEVIVDNNANLGDSKHIKVDGAIAPSVYLYGAYADGDNIKIKGKALEVNDSELMKIRAAYATGKDALLEWNSLSLTRTTLGSNIQCALALKGGTANNNSLSITDCHSEVVYTAGNVQGAGGTAKGNILTCTNSTVGTLYAANFWAHSTSGNEASGNRVEVIGSKVTVQGVHGAYFYHCNGIMSDNTVRISNSTVAYGVTAAHLLGESPDDGESLNECQRNRVLIENNSTVANALGVEARYTDASYNSVTVMDSTVTNKVVGAQTGSHADADASYNKVVIQDSTVLGEIIGGDAGNSGGDATNNSVTLRGHDNNLEQASIYGGRAQGDSTTGNALVLDGFQGTVNSVQNIDSMDITLRDWDPSAPVLVTKEEMDLSGVTVTLRDIESISEEAALPGEGDALQLFNNAVVDDTTTQNISGEYTGIKYGKTRLVDLRLGDDPDAPALMVADVRLNPQLKALSEGRVAALTFANRAGNLVAEKGIGQAALAAWNPQGGQRSSAFFAMSAGHDKVDSGSHVDADGVSTMLGASTRLMRGGALTLGGFMESGWGQYTTHNAFEDMASVRGSGESSYYGGGVLLRYDLSSLGAQGLSLDASLRAGRQATDFGSYDVDGEYASYDTSSPYVAGHLGLGYCLEVSDKVEATFYARYLWSHLGSEHADIPGGRMVFESVSSNRLRFGASAAWQLSEKWRPYAGLAYEWECSGSARATVDGGRVESPSMRGGSLIGEVGTRWQPWLQKALWFEGGVHVSAGKTQGFGAHAGCTIAF